MEIKYLPDLQSFASGLPVGQSKLAPEGHRGKTKKERQKQSARWKRIRDRSQADASKKSGR